MLHIFISFLKISPLTFGGGIAMIPQIESEIVNKRNWLSSAELPNILAVAQSAPGSIAINAAIYIGYTVRGVWGSLAAMFGMLLPANLIIILLTYLFLTYHNLPMVQDAFQGIRPAIIALILFAAFKIGRHAIQDRLTAVLFILAVSLLVGLAISPVFMIIGGGLIGWMHHLWSRKRG
nr:chromate transporter [Thalassobacillus sp. CUG 92003]